MNVAFWIRNDDFWRGALTELQSLVSHLLCVHDKQSNMVVCMCCMYPVARVGQNYMYIYTVFLAGKSPPGGACLVGSISIVPDTGSFRAWRPARGCALEPLNISMCALFGALLINLCCTLRANVLVFLF